ncbi:MAG: hypothetical protein H0X37_13910 [Herpetosiphonaceae bacterium]|nr:hypothetical protein [Herpetosiphonaceae bacterium]
MTKTVVGLFETQEAAEAAVNALIPLGYSNAQIGVALRGEIRAASASSNDPLLIDIGTDGSGVRQMLDQGATSGWNAEEYASQLNYSGVVVTVQAEESQVGQLQALLQRYGALDLAARQPSQTIDPTEAAVQEADAVDKPATAAVSRELTQHPAESTSEDVPSPATNVPLASSAEVAATKPTGIATLRPGDDDTGATTPQAGATTSIAVEGVQQEQGVATGPRPRVRTYTTHGSSYQRSGDGYPTPDLQEITEPLIGMPVSTIASTETGANPPPRERDLTVGEQFGGAMENPDEEAEAEKPIYQALEGV